MLLASRLSRGEVSTGACRQARGDLRPSAPSWSGAQLGGSAPGVVAPVLSTRDEFAVLSWWVPAIALMVVILATGLVVGTVVFVGVRDALSWVVGLANPGARRGDEPREARSAVGEVERRSHG